MSEIVNLPHDGMIGDHVSKDATAKYDSGYFCGDTSNYTKYYLADIVVDDNRTNRLVFTRLLSHKAVLLLPWIHMRCQARQDMFRHLNPL